MERDVVPSWTSRSFPFVPRKSNDSVRPLADFRVASRTGDVPSSMSRVVARDRLSAGSLPLRRFRSSRLCPGPPRLGLWRLSGLITRMVPSSPRRTSPECFVRVRPWGFPLQGLSFVPDRDRLTAIACPPAVSVSVWCPGDRIGFRASPRSKSSPGADCYVGVGPLPSRGSSPLQGFQPIGLSAEAEPPQASQRR